MNTSTSSPAMQSRHFESYAPSTPTASQPPLPHSTSSPSISTSSSLPHLASPNTSKSKNYHPYLIQSTASSLLSRSNSSPSQPHYGLSKHRPSRSMSSLAGNTSGSEVDSPANGDAGSANSGDRRKSLESPLARRPMVRSSKSGTLPRFLEEKEAESPRRHVQLPANPKSWTPSELASYLDQTFRTGGEDGMGKKLPGPLVEDIKTWVLRQQVNGRAFLRGNSDSWGNSSRPPPFLPLLLSLSRRLRRASIQGDPFDPLDSASSVLHETDEDDEVSGVKRMANAFESRDSASDASEVEEDAKGGARVLRAQLTEGNGGWERWGLKRQNTGGSASGSQEMVRDVDGDAKEGLASSPEKEALVTPLLDDGGYVSEEADAGGTIKGPPCGLNEESFSPYVPKSTIDENDALAPMRLHVRHEGSPRGDRSRTEVTPTPERPIPTSKGLGFSPEVDSLPERPSSSSATTESPSRGQADPALSSPSQPSTRSRYASLGSKGRVPSLRHTPLVDGYDSSDEAAAPAHTMRRTTLRPTPAHVGTIFGKTSREEELEQQLQDAMAKVKALETRLEEGSQAGQASRPVTPTSSVSRPTTPGMMGSPMSGAVGFLLGKIGMLPSDDGLPTRVGQLPGYLFLVGVGVGAVMVRVLLGRAR